VDQIQVSVNDRTVKLKGTVRSLAEKRWAEDAARIPTLVLQIENQLDVAESNLSDQQLADLARRAIQSFEYYNYFDWLTVKADQGEVTLKGWTVDPWRKAVYERVVAELPGGRAIKNDIEVLSNSSAIKRLRIAVAKLIYTHPDFEAYGSLESPPIRVIVDGQEIILQGAVSTRSERQRAEALVRREFGPRVMNNLTIDRGLMEQARH
jgi:osmotically-inducible protein OsmY